MQYSDLSFLEISDDLDQASHSLPGGYKVQILYDRTTDCNKCNLFSPEGSIIDDYEGLDSDGVIGFIHDSLDLIEGIDFWNDAMDSNVELIEESTYTISKN